MYTPITAFIYSVFRITGGLLLHPYQTMQSLIREEWLVWMVLLPSFVLGASTIFWRFLFVPTVQLFLSCSSFQFGCIALHFVGNWLTFFCMYWQVLLLYLYFRFSWGLKD